MIKTLAINQNHEELIKAFCRHVKIVGYSFEKRAAAPVQELLYRMEKAGKYFDEITSEDIAVHHQYLLERPKLTGPGSLSLFTINGYVYILKQFFDYLQKTEQIQVHPMSVLSLRKATQSTKEILTKSEVEQLYKACKEEYEKAMLGLFYGCGLRKTEAEKLNLKDLDFRSNLLYIRIGKGRKRRVIPMSKTVAEDLKNYRYNQRPQQETHRTKPSDQKAFMLNKIGTRMRGNTYWKYFKELLEKSSIEKQISLHHLRHSIATHLSAQGMSIEEVSHFLGHQHLESTQIYTRVRSDQLKL